MIWQDWVMLVLTWIALGCCFDLVLEVGGTYRDFTGRTHRITTFVLYCILGPLMIPVMLVTLVVQLVRRWK